MTTRIAFVLMLLVAGLIALDAYMGWGGGLVAARHGLDLVNALAFWR